MNKKDLHSFFETLSQKTDESFSIYITGGILAMLYGGVRPTEDIDIAVGSFQSWSNVEKAILQTSVATGITVEFAEDISRWGMVGYRHFIKNAKLYKRFGRIHVYLLEPSIWSVGKMARYTLDDIHDVIIVFKKTKMNVQKALKTWSEAFVESPASSEKGMFVKKVEDFLKNYGQKIWGKKFDASACFLKFKKNCRIP